MEGEYMKTMFVCEKCKKVWTRRYMFNKKDIVYMAAFSLLLIIQIWMYWTLSDRILKPDDLIAKIKDGQLNPSDLANTKKPDVEVDTKATDAIRMSKNKADTALMEGHTNITRITVTPDTSNVLSEQQTDLRNIVKRVRRQASNRRRRCKRCKFPVLKKLEEDIAKLKQKMSELADTMEIKGISESVNNLAAVQFEGAGGTVFRPDKTDVGGFWIASWKADSRQEAVFSHDDVNENGEVEVLKTGLYIVYSQISLTGNSKRGYQVMRKRGSTGSVTSVSFCKETSRDGEKQTIDAELPSSCFTMKLCKLEQGDVVFIREMSENSGVVYSPYSSFFGLILIGK